MRRSASEIIGNLEQRIARLERQADAGTMSVQDLIKNMKRDGVRLLPNNPHIKYKDLMNQTRTVGRLLGDRMAGWLMDGKSVKIKGLSVESSQAQRSRVPSFVTPSGDFLFLDGYFQQHFENGFKESEYIQGRFEQYYELLANVDSAEELEGYEVKVPKLGFKWSNGTLTIEPKR